MEKEVKVKPNINKSQPVPCTLVVDSPKPVNYKICPLCGHSNKETEAHCKMCSYYLY